MCGAEYSMKGFLQKHMETKHGASVKSNIGGECTVCGNVLADARSLEKHMKNHLKCNSKINNIIQLNLGTNDIKTICYLVLIVRYITPYR